MAGNGRQCAKEKRLGYHATEAAAAQAYYNYVKDGIDPAKRREREGKSSQFPGVSWRKRCGEWAAKRKVGRCRLTPA